MSTTTYRGPAAGNITATGRDLQTIVVEAERIIRSFAGNRAFEITGVAATVLSQSMGNPIPDMWEATVNFEIDT